jgi:hypothetical protein
MANATDLLPTARASLLSRALVKTAGYFPVATVATMLATICFEIKFACGDYRARRRATNRAKI